MKKGIVEFVAKWPNSQQVKIEHKNLGCMAQNIELSKWKWEMINIDIITGLASSCMQHNSIWVIVNKMKMHNTFYRQRLPIKKMTMPCCIFKKWFDIMEFRSLLF